MKSENKIKSTVNDLDIASTIYVLHTVLLTVSLF